VNLAESWHRIRKYILPIRARHVPHFPSSAASHCHDHFTRGRRNNNNVHKPAWTQVKSVLLIIPLPVPLGEVAAEDCRSKPRCSLTGSRNKTTTRTVQAQEHDAERCVSSGLRSKHPSQARQLCCNFSQPADLSGRRRGWASSAPADMGFGREEIGIWAKASPARSDSGLFPTWVLFPTEKSPSSGV
jgi:hypothetical protein